MSTDDVFEGANLEETIGSVLSLLRNLGLENAAAALRQEMAEKYPDPNPDPSPDQEEENGEDEEEVEEDIGASESEPSSGTRAGERRVPRC